MDDFEQLDHYEILGVSRSASADEIKRAYRQQMGIYHPDRYAGAAPAEQEYASRRAQRINVAYQTLSDFNERLAYNRGLSPSRTPAARPRPTPPPAPRDHQAELYEQAREHLEAGRRLQAAATLRELLRLNPFYRDSAALLEQAEAGSARPTPPASSRPVANSSRRTLIVGGIGGLFLLGAGAAGVLLRRSPQGAATAATEPAAAAPSPSPGATLQGVAAADPTTPPTAPPSPSPSAIPTPELTATPEPTPTPEPTATPEPTPTPEPLAETGTVVYADDFSSASGWPQIDSGGWSVGYAIGGYRITSDAGLGNIWAYRTSPAGSDFLVGVDIEVTGGQAGLLLRYSEAGRYLAFLIDPLNGLFRLESRDGADDTVLVAESAPALALGPGAINRLAARLEGEAVQLRINGQPVADLVIASPPPEPRYGLLVVAGDTPAVALFRNLTIRSL